MNRTTAFICTLVLCSIIALVGYYGVGLTIYAAASLFFIMFLILFFLFYPVSRLSSERADFLLALIGFVICFAQFWLLGYLLWRLFLDVRPEEEAAEEALLLSSPEMREVDEILTVEEKGTGNSSWRHLLTSLRKKVDNVQDGEL